MMSFKEACRASWSFIKHHRDFFLVEIVLIVVILWSSSTLLTKPKLWIDEAISVNIARSFLTEGVLSPQTAPETFYQFPQLIQSTGYSVTVSLAGFFKVFGYGMYQARMFMLAWIVVALSLVFLLARKLFGRQAAYGSLLLVASFASFYGSGRTVVGEIPGFAFLLAGLYFFLCSLRRERYFLTGILWGLAVVTKPSVFGLIIPAVVLTLFFERGDFWRKIKSLISIGCGMIPAALFWIILVLPHPFDTATWRSVATFYKNPYSSSISQNVIHNLVGIFHSTTLMYFGLLSAVVLGARFLLKESNLRRLYTFVLVYGVLAFLYYLRSPGWLRYVFIAELLVLFILPHAVHTVTLWLKERYRNISPSSNCISGAVVGCLVIVQIVQMFTIAQIFSSDDVFRAAAYLKANFPEAEVGLLNAPELGTLLSPSKSFLAVDLTGMPILGENPLLGTTLPEVVVSYSHNRFVEEGKKVLDEKYTEETVIGGYTIYKHD